MALTKTPIELSSTPSIVDGGNATAITIDASENVTFAGTLNGISTTKSASGNRWGILPEVEGNGVMEVGRYLDFHSTDGDTSDYGARLDFNGTDIVSTNAFQMSSGIYLGGTGAANKLEDYEEGTWTPTPSSGSFSTNIATYTKVGRLVTVRYFCLFNSAGSGSGAMTISGLPFNVINSNSGYAPGITMVDNLTTATNNMTIQATINSSTFILIGGNGSTSAHVGAAASLFSSGSSFRGTLVYETT